MLNCFFGLQKMLGITLNVKLTKYIGIDLPLPTLFKTWFRDDKINKYVHKVLLYREKIC